MTTDKDLLIYYSGSAYNNAGISSIGGSRSNVLVPSEGWDRVFEETGLKELETGSENYRCLFLKNNSSMDSMINLSLFIEGKQSFEKISFGVSLPDSYGKVQMLSDDTEMPFNVEFYEANSIEDTVIIMQELKPGQEIALWLQRTITPTEDRNIVSEIKFNFSWS